MKNLEKELSNLNKTFLFSVDKTLEQVNRQDKRLDKANKKLSKTLTKLRKNVRCKG